MDIDTRKKIEAEAKEELHRRLASKGWPSSLIIEAIDAEIPYGAHNSEQWRGLEEHTNHAEAAAGNNVMRQIGNLSFEISVKIEKKDRLKNVIRDLPPGIREGLLERICLIEQGKRVQPYIALSPSGGEYPVSVAQEGELTKSN